MQVKEMWVQSLCREDPLEEGMMTHSSILAWRIPWTEETGGLWSIGLQRVGHNWSGLALTQEKSDYDKSYLSFVSLIRKGGLKIFPHVYACMCVCLIVSCLATRWTVAHQAPLAVGFSRQDYWGCFARCPRCPNPRAGKEKASKTMQLAKKGKFITDSNQGSCRASNTVVRGQRAPSRGGYPNL